jgi:hypothetical protein
MQRFRKVIVATALGGSLLTASAVPAAASEAELCRIMGPEYVEDAVACVCLVLSLIRDPGLPPGPQICSPS